MIWRQPRSLVFGVAVKVALATMAVTVCVLALIFNLLAVQGRSALAHTVDTDLVGLVDTFAVTGLDGLAHRIGDRLALIPSDSDQPYYLLIAPNGQSLAGNISHWPALAASRSEAGRITLDADQAWARTTVLRGGARLLVGRSMLRYDTGLKDVALLFALTLAVTPLCAYLIGRFAARALSSRVNAINAAFEKVGDGDVTARTPVGPAQDEIDQLASHVNRSLDRIDRLLAAHREVSDHIAHETRTPLMLLDQRLRQAVDATDNTKVLEPLFAAQADVRQLTRLLDALLDIAAAEALRGDTRMLGPLDISEILQSLAELYGPAADQLGITLQTQIEPQVMARADAMQVTRLVANLLDNALKYGASGQRVRLSLREGPVFVVEDDGAGFDPVDAERIFLRYQRASSGPAKGHGLGLALARAIAERHGWAIRAEAVNPDRQNRGARFTVAPVVAP